MLLHCLKTFCIQKRHYFFSWHAEDFLWLRSKIAKSSQIKQNKQSMSFFMLTVAHWLILVTLKSRDCTQYAKNLCAQKLDGAQERCTAHTLLKELKTSLKPPAFSRLSPFPMINQWLLMDIFL